MARTIYRPWRLEDYFEVSRPVCVTTPQEIRHKFPPFTSNNREPVYMGVLETWDTGHLHNFHYKDKRHVVLVCPICNYSTPLPDEIIQHMTQSHPEFDKNEYLPSDSPPLYWKFLSNCDPIFYDIPCVVKGCKFQTHTAHNIFLHLFRVHNRPMPDPSSLRDLAVVATRKAIDPYADMPFRKQKNLIAADELEIPHTLKDVVRKGDIPILAMFRK